MISHNCVSTTKYFHGPLYLSKTFKVGGCISLD